MKHRKLCWLAVFLLPAAPLPAEVIRIHIEDGRNGKRISNEHVQVWINGTPRAVSLAPDADGTAVLDAPAGSRIEIESNYYMDCRPFQKGAPRPTYSVDEVMISGIATTNSCGKVGAEARRGELLFFVRPLHWWEGVRR